MAVTMHARTGVVTGFPIQVQSDTEDAQGIGVATSAKVPININDKNYDNVIAVKKDIDGLVDVILSEGYRLTEGRCDIGPEHYTGGPSYGPWSGGILGHVTVNFVRLSDRTGTFVVNSHSGLNGTINVFLSVKYTKLV